MTRIVALARRRSLAIVDNVIPVLIGFDLLIIVGAMCLGAIR